MSRKLAQCVHVCLSCNSILLLLKRNFLDFSLALNILQTFARYRLPKSLSVLELQVHPPPPRPGFPHRPSRCPSLFCETMDAVGDHRAGREGHIERELVN